MRPESGAAFSIPALLYGFLCEMFAREVHLLFYSRLYRHRQNKLFRLGELNCKKWRDIREQFFKGLLI